MYPKVENYLFSAQRTKKLLGFITAVKNVDMFLLSGDLARLAVDLGRQSIYWGNRECLCYRHC